MIAQYSKMYSDPRDIVASLPDGEPNTVDLSFLGQGLTQLIDNIAGYKYKEDLIWDHGPYQARISSDCIAGTLDFFDNDGSQLPLKSSDAGGDTQTQPSTSEPQTAPAVPTAHDARRAGLPCQRLESATEFARRLGDQALTAHVSCDNGRSTGWLIFVRGIWERAR